MRFRLVWAILAMITVTSCAKYYPIYNVDRHLLPSTVNQLKKPVVRDAIVRVMESHAWRCKEAGSNTLICVREDNGQEATLEVEYTKKYFSLHYLGSHNMGYDKGQIHANYNAWVRSLEREITEALVVVK